MKAKFILQVLLILTFVIFLGTSLTTIHSSLLVKQELARQEQQLHQMQTLQQEISVDILEWEQNAVPQAILDMQSELQQSNQSCNHILTNTIWFILLLTALGFAIIHKMYYHIQSTLLKPIDKINATLSGILTDEFQLRRIAANPDTVLFHLTETCNLLLDNWQREKDHHLQVFRMLQKTAVQLIEILEEPTIAMVGSQEMVLANNNAKDFFIGEGGQRFFHFLTEAIKQNHSEFTSHGLRYTIKIPSQPKNKPDALITIYQFQYAGKVEQEGPEPSKNAE
jgi:hypothetical protein